MNTADSEKTKYERMWSYDDYRRRSPAERSLERALAWLGTEKDATFYDYGCGTGRAAAKLAANHNVHMLDITPDCLDTQVRASLGEKLSFTQVCLWEPTDIPVRDYGLCCDVMEHIPTDRVDAVLKNIAKTCKAVYFDICLIPDAFGKRIGQPLHLTVEKPNWWLDRMFQHWSDVRCLVGSRTASFCCRSPRVTRKAIANTDDLMSMAMAKPFEKGNKYVAVLCPGPSLPDSYGGGPYDAIVGVNRVVTAYPCTHWVAIDARLHESIKPIGDPARITSKSQCGNIIAKRYGFSSLTAIAYAAHELGAGVINLYGHDMDGYGEFDGDGDYRDKRTDERWRHEKEGYDMLVEYLDRRGVKIKRFKPRTVCGC